MKTPHLRLFCPAKLNLFLHITGQKSNGYHTLQSVFCALDFGDWLTFSAHRINDPPNNLPSSNPFNSPLKAADIIRLRGAEHIGDLSNNLIVKAADLLLARAQLSTGCSASHRANSNDNKLPVNNLPFIDITLQKNIPMGAGLGGGSSNAAAALVALNHLWQLNFAPSELQKLGATLGADVPFFVNYFAQQSAAWGNHLARLSNNLNPPTAALALAEGIGDKLTEFDVATVHALQNWQFLLIFPPVHNNTAHFFADKRLQKNTPALTFATIQQALQSGAIFAPSFASTTNLPTNLCNKNADNNPKNSAFFNAFLPIAQQAPAIAQSLAYLQTLTAHTNTVAQLTGTGSTVFLPIAPNMADVDLFSTDLLKTWCNNAPFAAQIAKIVQH